MALYQSPDFKTSFKSIGLLVQEKFIIDFQDSGHGSQLGFPVRMILATFDLQTISILPTKIRVSWPFSPGEEVQNKFSTWLLG